MSGLSHETGPFAARTGLRACRKTVARAAQPVGVIAKRRAGSKLLVASVSNYQPAYFT
jgi:hypothetical protein